MLLIDQSGYNGIKMSIYIITIVKDIYQFSQSIARKKKKKDDYNCKP